RNLAVMEIEQVLSDRESQSKPPELSGNGGFTLFEGIEEALSPRRLNPDPGICDLKDKMFVLIISRVDLDLPGWPGELGRIIDQIPKYLLNAHGVRSNE